MDLLGTASYSLFQTLLVVFSVSPCKLLQTSGRKPLSSHTVKPGLNLRQMAGWGSALRHHLFFWFWKRFKGFEIFHFIVCKKPTWHFFFNPWPIYSSKTYSFSWKARQGNSSIRLILAEKKILFHNENTFAKMLPYFSVSSIKYIYLIEGRDFFSLKLKYLSYLKRRYDCFECSILFVYKTLLLKG